MLLLEQALEDIRPAGQIETVRVVEIVLGVGTLSLVYEDCFGRHTTQEYAFVAPDDAVAPV